MSITQASARATVQAYHDRVAAYEQQSLKQQQQAAHEQQPFTDKYTACKSDSRYHDLKCGHRVKTEYAAECGVTCAHPTKGRPLLCPGCLTEVVRAEVALEELSLKQDFDTKTNTTGTPFTQTDKVKEYADLYVARELRKGYRACTVVKKYEEPRMQFFGSFMQELGLGDDETKEDTVSPKKKRKLPGDKTFQRRRREQEDKKNRVRSARVAKTQQRVGGAGHKERPSERLTRTLERGSGNAFAVAEGDGVVGLVEQLEEFRVDLPLESKACEAVRIAMEKFSI
ncbi:hypothetical protein NX059_010374 [Plenodomus lindquistii]|nr:hypothetical protein NX059_010374 [Plenodomus lindquistii]